MRLLLHLCYNFLALPVLAVGYVLMSLVHPKTRDRFLHARASLRALDALRPNTERLWFHAASMGEFEQLKPVIEQFCKDQGEVQIVVSFSSPSGYNNQLHYPFADAVVYLPFDGYFRIKSFLSRVQPSVALFARYDLWWNLMHALQRRKVPALLLNATFSRSGFSQGGIGRAFYKNLLNTLHQIYALNESEYNNFEALKLKVDLQTSRDTRYDRLFEAQAKATETRHRYRGPSSTLYASQDVVVVLGSVWPIDVDLFLSDEVLSQLGPRLRYLIVPHEPNEEFYRKVELRLGPCTRWSAIDSTLSASRHLIVDSIGQLLKLYALADAAYVGGGFGVGVHSVAEAACYGIPVSCGPQHDANADAVELIHGGSMDSVTNSHEIITWLHWIDNNREGRAECGRRNSEYIERKAGASLEVARRLRELLEANARSARVL